MTSVRRSLTGFVWGLILIGLGTVLLAWNVGYDVPIWTGIATWWPILLVVWGVVKTVDYVLMMRRGETGRLFSPGEVFLLIFVVLAGTAASAAIHVSPTLVGFLEMADIEFLPMSGTEFSYTEQHELEGESGATIEIVNRYGSIDVLPNEEDTIVVDVQKTIIAADQEAADALAELLTFSIVREVPAFRVISTFNRDANSVRGRRIRTSLVVRVPASSSVRIDNRNGSVRVTDLTGNQEIVNALGDVELRNVTGSVDVQNSRGRVAIEEIGGSAVVRNEFEVIRVQNVGGDLELTSRNGNVEITGVGGDAEVTNSFARTEVSEVTGELTLRGRNDEVEARNVSGDVDIETSFEDVRIENARGEVRVTTRNGEIELRFPEPPQDDIAVEAEFSTVTIELPPTSSFRADLRTRFGEIETDFALPVANEGPERLVRGTTGQDGPTVRVRTSNGDIRLNGM